MTDLEINIAIAEAMPRCKICGWKATRGHRCTHSPDYCHDLNAMHEAETTLRDSEAYLEILKEVCRDHYQVDLRFCVSATARQRAEAFRRTIGKWKP